MSMNKALSKAPPLKLVTTNSALKLAEQWVNNMSKSLENESTEEEEGRPPRLGIGAKVPRQAKIGLSNDPVERNFQALHTKLDRKRKAAQTIEQTIHSVGDKDSNDEDEDEESESRTSSFVKKKALPLTSSFQVKKKVK